MAREEQAKVQGVRGNSLSTRKERYYAKQPPLRSHRCFVMTMPRTPIKKASKPAAKKGAPKQPRNPAWRAPAGGAATAGGMNFQAAITAICAAHMLRGTPIRWLPTGADDTPTSVWAETNGPGDDVRLETSAGLVEIQAKKGLTRGLKLWDPLLAMAKAIHAGTLDYGVIAVAPDTSGSVKDDLSRDILRLADGRHDDLTEIGKDLKARLERARLPVKSSCARIRIQIVHALEIDGADVKATLSLLCQVCTRESDAFSAWTALYAGASVLIARKGRWSLKDGTDLLRANKIDLRDADFPAALLARLSSWTAASNSDFCLPGLKKRLPLSKLVPLRTTASGMAQCHKETAAEALARYHGSGEPSSHIGEKVFDAEWTGRFRRRAVVVAGPGLGKSTLITQLAGGYAADGYAVLKVNLKLLAASMRAGATFENSLVQQGLDGSGVTAEAFTAAKLSPLVVLADGLDDCGDQHDTIAEGLARFARGYPTAHIVVTTRPVGYVSGALSTWSHYSILAPDKDDAIKHLAALVGAAAEDPQRRSDAQTLASREYRKTSATATIASSPLMLAMAASLIVRSGALPASRAELYQQMVATVAANPRAKAGQGSEVVAEHVLNVLGWLLIEDPLTSRQGAIARCARHLQSEMGLARLAAEERAEGVVDAWEAAGIVERLHHPTGTLLTFIHKSFAEFTAARFLTTRELSDREALLAERVENPAWDEVFAFAGGLGAGDDIARLHVARENAGVQGQLLRALRLLRDPNALLSSALGENLLTIAFSKIVPGDKAAMEIGAEVAELASVRPELVGPEAAKHLGSEVPAVRLAAWAAAVSAGSDTYTADQLSEVLAQLAAVFNQPRARSLLGGYRIYDGKDRDLIQIVGLAALRAAAEDQIDDVLEQLDGPAFDNVGFRLKLGSALRLRGRTLAGFPFEEKKSKSAPAAVARWDDPAWDKASVTAYRAVASAVSRIPPSPLPPHSGQRLLHFSALMGLTGFMETELRDVHAWSETYDIEAVNEVLRLLVAASRLDPAALAAEGAEVIRKFDADPALSIFRLDLGSVDLPEPDWTLIHQANPDWTLLTKALGHGSVWLVRLAASSLQQKVSDEAALCALLASSRGFGVAVPAHLIATQLPSRAPAILLESLDAGLSSDSAYIIRTLHHMSLPAGPLLVRVVGAALTHANVDVAVAGARWLEHLVASAVVSDPTIPETAFQHWLVREQPTPRTGFVPASPREPLARVLLALGRLDDDRLLDLLNDPRSDVRAVAEKRLMARIVESPSARATILDRITAQTVPAAIAAKLLDTQAPFEPAQVSAVAKLRDSPEGKWRLVAMRVMRPGLMEASEIEAFASDLLADPETEIKDKAKRVLAQARA